MTFAGDGAKGGTDFWTERLDTRNEQIVLTWYQMGEPLLVHYSAQCNTGATLRNVHCAYPGARCAAHPQWDRGPGSALAKGARKLSFQHLCVGTMPKLDAGVGIYR